VFDDARTLPDGSRIEADLLIIGAGAAGTTIASEFIGQVRRVVVVEGGGVAYQPATQKLYRGTSIGHHYEPLDLCRVRMFGGSTDPRGWGGWCKPLGGIDFEVRPWVPLSGWPLSKKDLDPFYQRALGTLGLPTDVEAMAAVDARSADVLTLEGPMVINEPCPLSPAPHLGHVSRDKLASAKNVHVLLNANVTKIVTDNCARQAVGVEVETLCGKAHRITAQYIVLAAGGVENARLLLLSDQVQKEGLGNGSDFVGRCFMEHPRFTWGRLSGEDVAPLLRRYDPGYVVGRRVIGAPRGSQQLLLGASIALSEFAQRSEELLGARSWLMPAPDDAEAEGGREIKELVFWLKKKRVPSDLSRRLRRVVGDLRNAAQAVHAHLSAKFSPPSQWQFVTVLEQEPYRASRISLDASRDRLGLRRVQLDWRLGPLTRKTLGRAVELFSAEMKSIGLRCAITGSDGRAGPDIDCPRWVWHHMGTTRMSTAASEGVVDADCRVHGLDNLFIAGSSVFPTAGNDMPTLTVVALAHRLADHLKMRMSSATSGQPRRSKLCSGSPALH